MKQFDQDKESLSNCFTANYFLRLFERNYGFKKNRVGRRETKKELTDWFLFDVEKGYNSCGYLGRITRTSNQFSEEENDKEVERAIDEILKYDFRNIYKKVKRTT